jgi:hypothetical protein
MALKFRRGSTADKSGSLSFGEPYVNSTLGTLQVGGASGDITLATQGNTSELVALSVSASSFVSASKLHITGDGEIKGNLVLGGNITIGDQSSDTVAVTANLSSSLIPSITNTFDLGSVNRIWKDIFVSTGSIKFVDPGTNTVVGTLSSNASGDFKVSGELSGSSVAGLGNAQQYSASINSKVDALQSATQSINQSFHQFSGSINTYTASNDSTNITQNGRLGALETESGSVRSAFNSYTASNDSTNTTQNSRLGSLETTSGSLVSFSASVATGIQLTGSNVTIKGNLMVKGTTTTIDSTTVQIGDNIIELNGSGAANAGIVVRDVDGTTTSGSLVWDSTADYWKAGVLGSEQKIVLDGVFNGFSSSINAHTASANGRLGSLETASGSIRSDFNDFTSSHQSAQNTSNLRLNSIEATTASLNTYTASADNANNQQNIRLNAIESTTGSLNSFTASATSTFSIIGSELTALETESGSVRTTYNSYTASNDGKISAIHISTGSLNTFTSSINTTIKSKLNTEGVVSGSSQITISDTTGYTSFSSSIATINAGQDTKLGLIETSTGSLNTFTSSINTTIKSKLNVEGVFSGSAQVSISDTTGYNSFSASIATMNDSTNTTLSSSIAVTDLSQNNRLNTIESRYATTGSNSFLGTQNITGSLYISDNLTVYGSSSLVYVTSSQLAVSSSFISVNVFEPAERFGGLKVYDSGSSAATASIAWDSLNNRWVYQNVNGASYNGAMFISGPRNTGSLGDEQTLTNHRIPKSIGGDHIGDSIMHEYTGSNTIGISGSLTVTGSISASGGIDGNSSTTTKWATARTITLGGDLSGNVSIDGTSDVTLTATIGANSVALGTDTTGDYVGSLVAGTGITLSNNSGEGATPTIALTNNAITIAGNSTSLGGSISAATILSGTGVFSGSAQITTLPSVDTDDLVEGVTNLYYLDSRVKTKLNTENVISGSSQVFSNVSGDITIASNGVATIAANSVALGTDTTGAYVSSLVAGTGITLTNNSGEGATPTVALTNSAITIAGTSTSLGGSITAATILSGTNVVSGSSQISLTSVTGYVANEHINHANVSISAGNGISGGGDITATRTITLDTGSAHFIAGARGTNSAGTGISYSGGVIANTGVTSNVAGTGISVSGATGAVTITNTGVTSAVAGTGVTVSGATGAVTFSIGQAVATTSEVQFAKVGVGGASDATYELKVTGDIGATGDIVAYISSDKRFKDNVVEITDSLDKVRKIRGVKWDWNDNASDAAKQSPNVGVIAQEVQQVLPEIVHQREDGYLAVDYTKMAALFIEAIKEQQIQIENLKLEVEGLKKQKGL